MNPILPPNFFKSSLILSFHLGLCLQSDLLPSHFTTKHRTHFSYPLYVSHSGSSHLSRFDNRIIFCEQPKLWSSSLCNFLLPPVTFTTLTFKNVRFDHTVHYDSGNSQQLFFPNSIKNLFFVMVTQCVFWNTAQFLNIIYMNVVFQRTERFLNAPVRSKS